MSIKNSTIDIIILTAVIILAVVGSIIYFNDKKPKPVETKTPKIENTYNISDDSLGIYFMMDNSFTRIDNKTLQEKGPYFIYGFKPKDVENVSCYVTQTSRPKAGKVDPEYLKDGVFEQVKNIYPDLKLITWNVLVSSNDATSIKMYMQYNENNISFKQIEYVGTTDARTTFAFCSSPESLFDFYSTKFSTFINSIQIN